MGHWPLFSVSLFSLGLRPLKSYLPGLFPDAFTSSVFPLFFPSSLLSWSLPLPPIQGRLGPLEGQSAISHSATWELEVPVGVCGQTGWCGRPCGGELPAEVRIMTVVTIRVWRWHSGQKAELGLHIPGAPSTRSAWKSRRRGFEQV